MKCPNYNEILVMNERQCVEIDYCPACRGVWLDKGELDKIIERSDGRNEFDSNQHETSRQPYGSHSKHGSKHSDGYSTYGRKGLLGNLFDF